MLGGAAEALTARRQGLLVARDLIAQGALVDATATDGSTPLMRAPQEGHVEVIRVLCDSHASLELSARAGTALGLAAFCGHVEAVRALLEGGASVGGRALDGMTPLMRAAAGGQRQVLEMLIAHNAEVNARSASGLTALMLAAHSGHGDVASRLIELGAGVDDVDDDFGASALLFAVDGGHPDAALRLLEAGGSPTLPRRDRVTPLMLASDRGLADVVRALIGRGADINAVDKEGHGALFRATRRGESRAEIAVILHAAGANPDT